MVSAPPSASFWSKHNFHRLTHHILPAVPLLTHSAHGDITLYDDAAAQRAVIMTCFQDIDKARYGRYTISRRAGR